MSLLGNTGGLVHRFPIRGCWLAWFTLGSHGSRPALQLAGAGQLGPPVVVNARPRVPLGIAMGGLPGGLVHSITI